MEDFQGLLLSGDHEILHTVLHWCLQRFEHLQKRAYLARFLMPVEIPAEFMGEDLVMDLSQRLKELQADFKEVHKTVDHVRSQGARPGELKNEIAQLEQEKTQLRSKIQKLKRDAENEGANFDEMLKVTSALRKEQEEELRIHDRLREYRRLLQEAENRFNEVNRRLSELRSSGVQGQTAEQLFQKLQKDVKELSERRDSLEAAIVEREVRSGCLTRVRVLIRVIVCRHNLEF
jgi:intraflagellar transport protein 81